MSEQAKKEKHDWRRRDGHYAHRWCGKCGIYEDTFTETEHTRSGITMTNVTVFRPMGQPGKMFGGRKIPECCPRDGVVAPPPEGKDALTKALTSAR